MEGDAVGGLDGGVCWWGVVVAAGVDDDGCEGVELVGVDGGGVDVDVVEGEGVLEGGGVEDDVFVEEGCAVVGVNDGVGGAGGGGVGWEPGGELMGPAAEGVFPGAVGVGVVGGDVGAVGGESVGECTSSGPEADDGDVGVHWGWGGVMSPWVAVSALRQVGRRNRVEKMS
ncbi:Uncharacterised protein [Dermatophilus congolensis]|uniref:Uncharacterized protein n=1 Tax=Dermatophilus congolensis TaxID=1863 RepID=A0AA46BL58_9MICO|nr:Uncharacterised protein [Dermatophilus congolensis]